MSELPVWGVLATAYPADAERLGMASHMRQMRVIVAARSRAAASRAFIQAGAFGQSEVSVSNYLRDYGGQTGNDHELRVARSAPGVVFARADSGQRDAPYVSMEELRA